MKKKNFVLGAILACACIAVGINSANAMDFDDSRNGVPTGFATKFVPDEPTVDKAHQQDPVTYPRESAYTVVDSAGSSNTGFSFIRYEIDQQTKEIVSQATKYIDLKKTTYNGVADSLTYSWNDTDKTLTVTKSGEAVKTDNVEYIGNTTSDNGGAINNSSTIETLTGDFIGNSATGSSSKGGAIWNNKTITTLTGDFIGNSSNRGGAIYNGSGTITTLTGDFIGNSATGSNGQGGAIYNSNGTITTLTGDFIGNKVLGDGGAIYNSSGPDAKIETLKGDFIGNSAKSGGAIDNYGTITTLTGDFIGNSATGDGGAIWNNYYNSKITTLTGDFIGNSATGEGGAIFNGVGQINLVAGDRNITFTGNTAGGVSNAIFNGSGKAPWQTKYKGIINLNAKEGRSIIVNDGITMGIVSVSGRTEMGDVPELHLNKTGIDGVDDTIIGGEYEFNNTVSGNSIFLYNGAKLKLGTNVQNGNTYYGVIDNTEVNGVFQNDTNGGFLDTVNNHIDTQNFGTLVLNSNLNMNVDVDLQAESMDKLSAGAYTINNDAKVIVSGMNLLNDADKDNTKIFFAEEGLANSVDTTVTEVAYSPIYKYDVNYVVDESDNKGYFTFARSASGGSGEFNPAVEATPVATQAAAQVTVQQAFNYSFSNSDTFMLLPKQERIAIRNRNKYALAESELPDGSNPLYQIQDTSSAWFKPYASFENVPLKNGPKVNVISYGALAGYDTDLKELKRGWARAWTGFVGYNGASINYSDVSTIQNGGLFGGTLTMYKGNFFNATTLSVGATVGDNHTMYGHETTTSLLSGLGNKTGYNFEFKDGKFIVQPNLFLGYTMVKTFNYTNAAGVRIDSNPAHTFQISPGLKFIGNLKHGWQPYIGINMVWNVLNSSHVSANSVTLPQMSVKPYIQYGLGLQKTVKDNFVAYGQAMVQNGGRNGISLTAGFRWAIGKDKPVEKVQKPTTTPTAKNDRKEIKVSEKKAGSQRLTARDDISLQGSNAVNNTAIHKKSNGLRAKIRAFFAKMDGEPLDTTRTGRVAVIK